MSEEMIAPIEAATFLRNHHIWCTARDGRFGHVAALIERLASQSAYNPNERLREALERAAENFERLQVPHLVGNDVHNFAYQAAKAARSALSPLPQGEDTEMCDACDGSGVMEWKWHCGKCGGAGGYPLLHPKPLTPLGE